MIYPVIYLVNDSFLNNSTVMFYRYFREIEITNLFFRKNRLHVTMSLYETRVESSDNGLTELKKGTGQALRKHQSTRKE